MKKEKIEDVTEGMVAQTTSTEPTSPTNEPTTGDDKGKKKEPPFPDSTGTIIP